MQLMPETADTRISYQQVNYFHSLSLTVQLRGTVKTLNFCIPFVFAPMMFIGLHNHSPLLAMAFVFVFIVYKFPTYWFKDTSYECDLIQPEGCC